MNFITRYFAARQERRRLADMPWQAKFTQAVQKARLEESPWKSVPMVPTDDMRKAGLRTAKMDCSGAWIIDPVECYAAMLAAAPAYYGTAGQ